MQYSLEKNENRSLLVRGLLGALTVYVIIIVALMLYWSREPGLFDVNAEARKLHGQAGEPVKGYVTTAMLIHVTETLLGKPGGYLSNDIFPPGVLLDNMPNWEFGVITQVRDMARALQRYLARLGEVREQDAQFYARADNLRDWLAIVEKRLGSLSQRLSASVGQIRVNTDLQGDSAATQSTGKPNIITVKTPWLEIDDVFYEARGS